MKSLLSKIWLPILGLASIYGLYWFQTQSQANLVSGLNRVCTNLEQKVNPIEGVASTEVKTLVLAAQQADPTKKVEIFLKGTHQLGQPDWKCAHLDLL